MFLTQILERDYIIGQIWPSGKFWAIRVFLNIFEKNRKGPKSGQTFHRL